MQDLIQNIVGRLGLDPAIAEKAVGYVLSLLQQHGPADKVQSMLGAMPGASDLISKISEPGEGDAAAGGDASASSGGLGALGASLGGGLAGGLGGMVAGALGGGGGGIMDTLGKLQGLGLNIDQAKGVGIETLNYAREKAGDDTIGAVVDQVPGLKDLL
ncbi:MAG: hypothetical protein AAFR04_08735 [Pseudomonadota bacterium]